LGFPNVQEGRVFGAERPKTKRPKTKQGADMRTTSILLASALALAAGAASAADLTVYTGGSMLGALKAVGADFTKKTGTPVAFVAGTTTMISKKITAGEKADVVAISKEGVAALQTAGLVTSDVKPLANAIFGMAVKAGAPKPDISSLEAFKHTLQAAKVIAYPDPKAGATAGVYIQGLMDRLGIAAEMGPKTVVGPTGAEAAEIVAQGKADLVITFVSELQPDPGVSVVGPLPAAVQSPTLYSIGVAKTAADPAKAKAFIDFATSAAERARLKAAGVDPAS
jgi:molybdate transport system substrate-binding protein